MKTLIFFLALIISAPAMSFSQHLKREDFLQTTKAQRKELIKSIMLVIVSLEKESYDAKTIRRKSVYIRKLKSFFNLLVSEAYAQENGRYSEIPVQGEQQKPTTKLSTSETSTNEPAKPDQNKDLEWQDYANSFSDIVTTKDPERCFYGGWPSKKTISKEPKSATCQNPRDIEDSAEKKYFLEGSKDCSKLAKEDELAISCNPVVFGYKKFSAKSLFCVSIKKDSKESLAKKCMDLSLGNEVAEGVGDLPEERMDFLSKRYAQVSKDTFDKLIGFVTKNCVCPINDIKDDEIEKYFSEEEEQAKLCSSYLNMVGNMGCTTHFPDALDTGFFSKLSEQLKKDPKVEDAAFIKSYASFITKTKKENPDTFSKMCPSEETETCEIKFKEKETKLLVSVEYLNGKNIESYKWNQENSEKESLEVDLPKEKKKFSVELKFVGDKKLSCEKEFDPDNRFKIELLIVAKGYDNYKFKATISPENKDAKIKWAMDKSNDQINKAKEKEGSEGPDTLALPRIAEDYQVCAPLFIKDKKTTQDCKKVDKFILANPAAVGAGDPPMELRPANNTSATGIK